MSKELQTAIKAAKEAGEILKDYFIKKDFNEISKGGVDIVTEADTKSEEKIISIIKKEFPEHQIIAEESGFHKSESGYIWIIDPLDGTYMFVHGIDNFAISIALQKNNEIILGVIYNPIKDEMYHAEKGKGAYLNGKKIHVSKRNKLIESIINTGFGYERGKEMDLALAVFNEITRNSKYILSMASAAMDIAHVASGKTEGYCEMDIKPWDIAAGKIIVEEAGGKVTSGKTNDFDVMNPVCIATNGLIHKDIQKIIGKYI